MIYIVLHDVPDRCGRQFGLVVMTYTEMGDHGVSIPSWYLNQPVRPTQPGHPSMNMHMSTGNGLSHC